MHLKFGLLKKIKVNEQWHITEERITADTVHQVMPLDIRAQQSVKADSL